ncbi:uncharacterized protein B0I36DRAFT_241275 [Microdochium trichocladiopsis]|uniref:Tyrosinase copper-binding domain-containing protein n=1 Tax=Microdochium trichocladiopsis TaxID=1682393 RepID=A0A9P8YAM6_9PEZI|nr:uncharacterized protein B0I36DRAFT_241275 [Microdochium trichocladiopsis]KAH7032603.1 hypothetical protein B0I36DRAFT_241275 [Microdochium trichocladiopsis]
MLSRSLLLALTASAATANVIPRQDATTCTSPVVRKEWRELSTAEKTDYLKAAVCVRNLPKQKYAEVDAVKTRMDDLTYTHLTLNQQIHFVANFLPWHRWYVQLHEDMLRDECGYTGRQPYWDWSIESDTNTMPVSPIWDAETGFGGNGVLTGNQTRGFSRCVMDGPFANTTYTLGPGWPNINDVVNEEHCFAREWNGGLGRDPATGEQIIDDMQAAAYSTTVMRTIHNFNNYYRMSEMLEGLPHAQVHSIIHGDMGPATSPNEPLFMLHHANVDRAWARWQGRNETRLADYSGFNDRVTLSIRASIDDEMPVLELADTKPVVRDYMDTMAGPLCYTYSKMTL